MDESFGYTLPTALAPGMAAQFDIKPLSPSLAQKAKFASTNVQSEEFSSFDYNPSITPYQQQEMLALGGYSLYTVMPGQPYLLGSKLCYGSDCSGGKHHGGGGGGGGGNNNGCNSNNDCTKKGLSFCQGASAGTEGGQCVASSACAADCGSGGRCDVSGGQAHCDVIGPNVFSQLATKALITGGQTCTPACTGDQTCQSGSCQCPAGQTLKTWNKG